MDNMFIVIEGLDGAGKTTQIDAICKWLRESKGVDESDIVRVREPGGTPTGEAIRTILKNQSDQSPLVPLAELMLFFSSRVQLVETVIKPALAAGKWVIADRFFHSSMGYQGVGLGMLNECDTLVKLTGVDKLPHLQILIDVSGLVAMERSRSRGGLDTIESRGIGFFESIRQYYVHQVHVGNLLCVDGNRPPEYVTESLLELLELHM